MAQPKRTKVTRSPTGTGPDKGLKRSGFLGAISASKRPYSKNASSRIGTVRTKDGGTKTFRYNRRMAILMTCVECMGFETHPSECTCTKCPLYPFRGATLKTARCDK